MYDSFQPGSKITLWCDGIHTESTSEPSAKKRRTTSSVSTASNSPTETTDNVDQIFKELKSKHSDMENTNLRLWAKLIEKGPMMIWIIRHTDTSILGWLWKTCITRRYSARKKSLLCLATITTGDVNKRKHPPNSGTTALTEIDKIIILETVLEFVIKSSGGGRLGEAPYMIAGDFRGGIMLSLYWMPFSLIPRHYLLPIFFLLLAKMFLHTSADLEGTEHG